MSLIDDDIDRLKKLLWNMLDVVSELQKKSNEQEDKKPVREFKRVKTQ